MRRILASKVAFANESDVHHSFVSVYPMALLAPPEVQLQRPMLA
jgi:hypothetical protein